MHHASPPNRSHLISCRAILFLTRQQMNSQFHIFLTPEWWRWWRGVHKVASFCLRLLSNGRPGIEIRKNGGSSLRLLANGRYGGDKIWTQTRRLRAWALGSGRGRLGREGGSTKVGGNT